MNKLSMIQENARADMILELKSAKEAVESALGEANEMIDNIDPVIRNYNRVLQEAIEYRKQIVEQMNDHITDMDAGWASSDKGLEYLSWKTAWENFNPDPLHPVTHIDNPDMPSSDELDNLPSEPVKE